MYEKQSWNVGKSTELIANRSRIKYAWGCFSKLFPTSRFSFSSQTASFFLLFDDGKWRWKWINLEQRERLVDLRHLISECRLWIVTVEWKSIEWWKKSKVYCQYLITSRRRWDLKLIAFRFPCHKSQRISAEFDWVFMLSWRCKWI